MPGVVFLHARGDLALAKAFARSFNGGFIACQPFESWTPKLRLGAWTVRILHFSSNAVAEGHEPALRAIAAESPDSFVLSFDAGVSREAARDIRAARVVEFASGRGLEALNAAAVELLIQQKERQEALYARSRQRGATRERLV